ncbi:MAG TPA: sulfotransferase [Actinomycetota bacterium]|nr:sulfotransferase [Actinomycetota bacterium]
MRRISAPARWVLVTGAPRSGTTFVGRILSSPLTVDYIHEPFNPDCGIDTLRQLLAYTRRGLANEREIAAAVRALLDYRARLRTAFYRRDTTIRRLAKAVAGSRGPFHYRLARFNPWHRVALVKDPVGCLLTEYLVDEFGFTAVILVRHPLAVAQSFARLGWDANRHLAALRTQPDFIADHLTAEDAQLIRRDHDNGWVATAVLWRVLYRALARQAAATGTAIVRHEDLSERPVQEFRALCDRLALPWSDRVERRVLASTSGSAAAPLGDGPAQQLVRDSARIDAAARAGVPEEVRREILELCDEVAGTWYEPASYHT